MNALQDKEFQVLLTLLRAGLWERAVDDLSLFPLSGELWSRVFTLSCEQTVAGVVYRGITHLPNELMPTPDVMMRWVAQIDAIERHNERMNSTLCALYQKFVDAGLHPLLQKGAGIAQMYEHPLLREAGDVDFWFAKEEWEQAAELVKHEASDLERLADGSVSYHWRGVEVEHHLWMFDLCNPFKQRYLATLIDDTNIVIKKGQMGVRVPAPLTNIVLQNTHILKHAICLGVGLRQLCDLARTYYSLGDVLDGEQVQRVYDKLGVKRWSDMLHSFLVEHIGLEAKYLPYAITSEEDTAKFLEEIRRGGNFGLHSEQRSAASKSALRRKMHTFFSSISRVGFFMRYTPVEFIWRFGGLITRQVR